MYVWQWLLDLIDLYHHHLQRISKLNVLNPLHLVQHNPFSRKDDTKKPSADKS